MHQSRDSNSAFPTTNGMLSSGATTRSFSKFSALETDAGNDVPPRVLFLKLNSVRVFNSSGSQTFLWKNSINFLYDEIPRKKQYLDGV